MEIQKTSVFITDDKKFDSKTLYVGEKINATLIKDLGNGFYTINIKGKEVNVKSSLPLKNNEIFIVIDKKDNQIVLSQQASTNTFNFASLINGFSKLRQFNSPLMQAIVFEFLRKNSNLDESKILRIFSSIKDFQLKELPNGLIRFLINLIEDGININGELVKLLLDYVKFIKQKRQFNEKKLIKETFSDNKKEKLFSSEEKDIIITFLKNSEDWFKSGQNRGSIYLLLPFSTDEENFYSEIKVISEKNERGDLDWSFSANIHLTTGEVKIRGLFIQNYLYLKLYFENENFMEFCKDLIINEKFIAQDLKFMPMKELDEKDREELFSDIYLHDDDIEFC